MNDYKELIEELKAHCGCIIYDDDCDKCDGLESEKALCSLTMRLLKRCADAIEQLMHERFLIGEILVTESKWEIEPETALEQIRRVLRGE